MKMSKDFQCKVPNFWYLNAKVFLPFGEGGVLDIFVFNVFPWSSHRVHIKFSMGCQHVPHHVPYSSSFYPMSFALSCSRPKEEITTYLFWDCPKLDFYFYFFSNESIKDAHRKRKRIELWCPELNNMSHKYITINCNKVGVHWWANQSGFVVLFMY
jgi:hypothetical protein